MSWWQALILGIVEGLTEYLPVSSTGHLLLTQRLLGIPRTTAANAFAICVQAGAIVAVLGLYWQRIREMIGGVWLRFGGRRSTLGDSLGGRPSGVENPGFHLVVMIVVAFLPAAVLGKLFDEQIERHLFSLWYSVAAWFVGGLAILVMARRNRGSSPDAGLGLTELGWRGALVIGLLQAVAMWPGTSRSLMTILGGLAVGLSVTAAVEFSFLLGVVTLLAATVYKAKDAGPEMVSAYGWLPLVVGGLAAWGSAVVAVRWMLAYLRRRGLSVFGWYRLVLAAVVATWLWSGRLTDEAPRELPSGGGEPQAVTGWGAKSASSTGGGPVELVAADHLAAEPRGDILRREVELTGSVSGTRVGD